MIIAVDFDGTITKKDVFPKAPTKLDLREGAIEVLIRLKNNGHKLILWTCRHGEYLAQAVEFCRGQGVEFDAINDNIQWTKDNYESCSSKIYADLYIDDKGLGGLPKTWYEIEKQLVR